MMNRYDFPDEIVRLSNKLIATAADVHGVPIAWMIGGKHKDSRVAAARHAAVESLRAEIDYRVIGGWGYSSAQRLYQFRRHGSASVLGGGPVDAVGLPRFRALSLPVVAALLGISHTTIVKWRQSPNRRPIAGACLAGVATA